MIDWEIRLYKDLSMEEASYKVLVSASTQTEFETIIKHLKQAEEEINGKSKEN